MRESTAAVRDEKPFVVARSAKTQEVLALVERVAPTMQTVLIGRRTGSAGHPISIRGGRPAPLSRSTAQPFPIRYLKRAVWFLKKARLPGPRRASRQV